MRRGAAALVVTTLAVGTAAALLLPAPFAVLLGGLAIACRTRGHAGTVGFALLSVAISAAVFAVDVRGPWDGGGWRLALHGELAQVGALVGVRLAAAIAVNFAILDRWSIPLLLDGLRLPLRLTGFVAAAMLGAQAVAQDARRLALAQRLEGEGSHSMAGRVRSTAAAVPALLLLGLRRAATRKDALRLAGLDTPTWFTATVAVTAIAAAGRLAFAVVPNVSPVYVVAFLAGVLFGPGVGAAAGASSMALTNLVLSGLLPSPFANVPAMALLGACGGWLSRIDWAGRTRVDRSASRILAGCVGFAATLLFSVVADAATWAITPEAWDVPRALANRIVAGLAFNLLPAAVNAAVFAAAVPAVTRLWRRLHPKPARRVAATAHPS